MSVKKGIILAGGTGSRLYPLTTASNKQLLPIYDKPAIYYPLTTLMLAGIQDILIISMEKDLPSIKALFGTGEQFGLHFSYQIQEKPNGLPEAFILGEKFINKEPVALILGDNFFHGHGLSGLIFDAANIFSNTTLFTYDVEDPSRYGVIILDDDGHAVGVEEKPSHPTSNQAITGLYYFDGTVSERAKALQPSRRGELEMVDLIRSYLQDSPLSIHKLGRGYVWFDAGTPKSLMDASIYVEVIQSRQGVIIASPEEVAWRMNFIDKTCLEKNIDCMPKSKYKDYLIKVFSS
jgi:glucose-1-phosphate thymidylyltransferase